MNGGIEIWWRAGLGVGRGATGGMVVAISEHGERKLQKVK